jgi:hypothetical protein
MSPKEFVALWGHADVVHPPETAAAFLSTSNSVFLLEAGLPRRSGLRLDFSAVDKGMPSLLDVLASRQLLEQEAWRDYRVLGQDNSCYLCLQLGRDHVVAVWPRQKLQRFVNTTISQLAECLLGFRDMSKASDQVKDQAYAEELRRYIRRVDGAALQDEESWWSVTVEQARYGDA